MGYFAYMASNKKDVKKTKKVEEEVEKVNYQEKLVQKEGDRDKARKNWQTIGNIKELKEGYLSNVVHEIAKMMVEHNAIVVMEDLNFRFKRGRFAVERQIYQKFENMLIEKLNYLVFKDKKVTEPGGVLNAYQLTNKSANVSDVYRQCGWLFYIPAAYTSKIDPKTGFANLFITKGLTNVEKKKEFFDKFDSIRYDSKEDCFVFGFDYGKICDNADFKKKWEVYTKGERLVYNNTERKNISINPTEELKAFFEEIHKDDYKWKNHFIEGFVFVDSHNFMFKYKCEYYKYWKYLRSQVEIMAKGGSPKIDHPFLKWVAKDKSRAKRDIISLRKEYTDAHK